MNTRLLALLVLGGSLIWARSADLKEVNLKYMLRGYCYAGSRSDTNAFGFGSSSNNPKELADKTYGTDGALSLVALPEEAVPFAKTYRGFRLVLVNRTESEVALRACNSRISILQEAQDKKGNWHPVEYLPSSWCGNSYHRVFLPKACFWEFAAPAYSGSFKTRLRFVLQEKTPIYSNEFYGSINPRQFTNKQGHKATDLMDPYNE
jgi:hypothetical protein